MMALDRKSFWSVVVLIGVAVLLWVGLFYYFSVIRSQLPINIEMGGKIPEKKEITEDVLKKFRATGEGEKIPEKTLKKFRASGEGEEIPEDILKKFRANN